MRWTTPTGRAEAVYAANRAAREPAPVVGPAGIPIPAARVAYRLTKDGPLLSRIMDAVNASHAAEQLNEQLRQHTADTLAADIAGRYPCADMAVLKRYGHARRAIQASIALDRPGDYQAPYHLPLHMPRDLPVKAEWFRIAAEGEHHPLPAECMPFAERVLAVRAAKKALAGVLMWPSQFKAREQRTPTWAEIEAAWPQLGGWMAYQRNPW